MARLSLLFSLLLIFSACEVDLENEQARCERPAGRAIDIVTGPTSYLSAYNATPWAFLSDELGGSGEALEFMSYPVYLNYPLGCRDSYTINIVHPITDYPFIPDGKEYVTYLTSYLNMPTGQAIELYGPLYRPSLPFLEVDNQVIVIEGLPPMTDWFSLPTRGIASVFDAGGGVFTLILPRVVSPIDDIYFYFVIQPEGQNQHYAVLVHLVDGPQSYDFSVAAQPVQKYSLKVPDCVRSIEIAQVLDPENAHVVWLIEDGIPENGELEFWSVSSEVPYLMYMEYVGVEGETHFRAQVFDQLPTEVQCMEKPIQAFFWTDRYMRFSLAKEGYFRAEMDRKEPWFTTDYRDMRGLFGAGEHLFNYPLLPDNLLDSFPNLALPTNLYENGHRLTYLHFDRAPDLASYPNLRERLPGIDRYNYHYYQVLVD